MRQVVWALLAGMLVIGGCGGKKADVDLFQKGKVRLDISSTVRKGYSPLDVNFSAYLGTKDNVHTTEISEVKWIITGPNRIKQEIMGAARNYQDEEANRDDFFTFDHTFRIPGTYRVQLEINNGDYLSNPLTISVWENPDPSRR